MKTNIHVKLKELRKQAGLTQKELAGWLGMAQSNYSRLEKGESSPSLENVVTLAMSFGVTYNELLGGDQNEYQPEPKKVPPFPNGRYYHDTALSVCYQVAAELERAKGIHPEYFVNQHEGYAVILEEVDELWTEIKKKKIDYDVPAQRKEAIQAAAMLVRFVVELT